MVKMVQTAKLESVVKTAKMQFLSGKDGVGQIGLTGPKGKDGKDGASVNITTATVNTHCKP